jgi:hypothetical protein
MDLNNSVNGANIELILDDEEVFKIKTLNALNNNDELKNFVMIKSQNKYCSIDFTIINTYNLLSVYVEHKKKKITASKYSTFFIGFQKLIMIDTYYGQQKLFLVFDCEDDLYFTEYDDKFLKREIKMICGSKVIEINKSECGIGFDNFNKKLIETLTL